MRLSLKAGERQTHQGPATGVHSRTEVEAGALEVEGYDLGFLARNAQAQRPQVVVTTRAVKAHREDAIPIPSSVKGL